jgi:hypothetical protein
MGYGGVSVGGDAVARAPSGGAPATKHATTAMPWAMPERTFSVQATGSAPLTAVAAQPAGRNPSVPPDSDTSPPLRLCKSLTV